MHSRLAVLVSGTGTNMMAIARACAAGEIDASIAVVISDVASAGALARASGMGLPAIHVDPVPAGGQPHQREGFEAALQAVVDQHAADIVVLAGFMRVLSPAFVGRHAGRMLNIHPSLLPRHKGLDTHARALAAGDREHGASVHFVTAKLDGGPVIAQSAVSVAPEDTVATISARVHAREHMLYPMVIQWLVSGRLQWNGGRPTLDGAPLDIPVRVP